MTQPQTGNDKVALVTGASSGIGRACAEKLGQMGYTVYGASRQIANAKLAQVLPLPMNVDDDDSVHSGIARIVESHQRIDVVVNCAGFGIAGAIEDTSVAEAKAQFETNFFGTLRVCRDVLPVMRAQKSGLLVNVSSLAGLTGIPFQGLYSATKYALEGLTESLRMEVVPFGVKVVLIEPGDFATGFTAQRQRTAASLSASAYRATCDKAIAKMAADEQHGPSPDRIARLLELIVQSPKPDLRYAIGLFSQTVGVGLKRVLPHRLYEKMLMQTYGL